MISSSEPLVAQQVPHTGIWPLEADRGVYAVSMLIITEAALFVCLFASYYFLGNNKDRWAIDIPPKLTLALVMLAILIASSLVMMWGERMVKLGRYSVARFAVILTVVMGLIFVAIQTAEYKDHWKTLTPLTDSYGSIFYTITTFHAAHVVMGILMLCYLAILPNYGPSKFPPHRPYRVVALYWHFVDIVWIFVVILLYLIPNYQAYVH
jgi:heme/copper-type cytochrome/quinol oxidase subunit 3